MADFFLSRLNQIIDLRHPLAVPASRLPRQELKATIAHLFAKAVRAVKRLEDVDLFGGVSKLVGAGASPSGRPRLPLRLMILLLYLKHAFNESDDGVFERLVETPPGGTPQACCTTSTQALNSDAHRPHC